MDQDTTNGGVRPADRIYVLDGAGWPSRAAARS
jgi:hypothetical protein